MDAPNSTPGGQKISIRKLPARLLFAIIYPGVLCAVLILVSGKPDWTAAWLFCGLYAAYMIGYVIWGSFRAPELMEERARPGPNAKSWDKVLMRAVYVPLLIALLVVCALDIRAEFSSVPFAVQIVGGLLSAASGLWIMWVLDVNRFASGVVRIQSDRGHCVISSGPYRLVRHPMYLGNVVFLLALPLILGSWLGLAVSVLLFALFVARAGLEDRVLQAELSGYAEYAKRVRKRLIPGIW